MDDRLMSNFSNDNSKNGEAGRNVKEVFLEQIWPKLERDYQTMSNELAKACKAELTDRSVPIPVAVEDRVKSRTSISKSLQRGEVYRNKENLGMYKDLHDILEDLHDLVGIRIIVEYLDHLKDVSEFVTGSFNQKKKPNRFHANRKVGHLWQPWFGAYECMNYHVSSKFGEDNRLSTYNGVIFEIQVTSLPTNMYNKIAHPLLYKEEAGPLSQGEEIVVDITKGLAYCYSLCLHFKRSKLGGNIDKQEDIELLRNMPSDSEELDESSISFPAGRIPKLDVAAGRTMDIPRESLRMVLDSLLNDKMPDDIGQALVDRFSREIEDIGQPPINLVTSGEARFDSRDVFSSPVCQAGTQISAIQYIHDWINKGEKALLWIYSHAGTEKSTLARTIARELAETGQIAAGYFFKRGVADRNDVSRVFPTIASQLMTTIPRYESILRKSIIASKNPDIDTMRLDEQFRVLIKGPLSEIDILASTKVIIIDALDECTDLINAAKIINLLSSLRSSSPLQFRLLVTSRDEDLAREAIEHQEHIPLPLATKFREDNISDIRSILTLGFENLRKETKINHTWPKEEQFEIVWQRSVEPSPLFIYAATLLRFLNNAKRTGYLEQRLDKWIEKGPGTADASQLEVMYTTVFENLDRNMDDGISGFLMDEEKEDLQAILGTIVLATEPLSREAISSISRVALGKTRGLLNLCRTVLEISDNDQKPVETVHKSFSDFLLRKPTDGRIRSWYYADEVKLNDRIAERCVRLLRTLRKDICDFKDPAVSREAINPNVIETHIPSSVQYASSYWWHHLQRGDKQGPSYDYLLPILKTHFLHWIECLSILDRLPFASKAEHPSESVHLLVPFLKDARRFILRHGYTIRENPLQTYGAALIFSPVESIVRPSFWETRNPGFRVIRNLEHRWGPCLKKVKDLSSISSISVSHDGQELAMAGHSNDRTLPSVWIRNTGDGILLARFSTETPLLALTWSCDGNYLLAITEFGEVVRLDRAIETTNSFGFSIYATARGNLLALTVLMFPSRACEHLRLPKNFVADAMAILPDYTTIFTTSHIYFTSWDLEAFSSIVEAPQQSDSRRLDDGCPIKKVAISPSGQFMIISSEDEQSLSLWRLPEATFERSLTVKSSLERYDWSFSQPSDISKDKEAFILLVTDAAHIWFLERIEDTHIKHPSSMKLPMGDLCLGSISAHRKEISKLSNRHPKYAPLGITPQHVNLSMTDGRMAAVSFNDTVEVSELGSSAKLYFDFKEPGNHPISAIALSPTSTYLAISYGTTIRI
ncbi:Ff.00g129850.m01.CDS01 [Fusarium sp. VM40]|nr:Ff.00g129850.m01.CDS01 [Fusarium sp. VM40]